MLKSGREEGLPYSLSRWTDVPAAKWPWFLDRLEAGKMEGFDPRTGVPAYWSLKPDDVLGLIFWTKNPRPLWRDAEALQVFDPEQIRVHVTATGWHEEEPGAPTMSRVSFDVLNLSSWLGGSRITWRFSPVPLLPHAILFSRFERGPKLFSPSGIREVFLSFLQPNDHLPERRSSEERIEIMCKLAEIASLYGLNVRLCNEDRTLLGVDELPANLAPGVCAPPEDFALRGREKSPSEGCGCTLAVEAFGINESCCYGCRYCYAADETLSGKKRNTTKSIHLPIVR